MANEDDIIYVDREPSESIIVPSQQDKAWKTLDDRAFALYMLRFTNPYNESDRISARGRYIDTMQQQLAEAFLQSYFQIHQTDLPDFLDHLRKTTTLPVFKEMVRISLLNLRGEDYESWGPSMKAGAHTTQPITSHEHAAIIATLEEIYAGLKEDLDLKNPRYDLSHISLEPDADSKYVLAIVEGLVRGEIHGLRGMDKKKGEQ